MKPVMQTRRARDGNCFQACLASIFELPLAAVPDPGPAWAGPHPEDGWAIVDDWLGELGLALVQMEFKPGWPLPLGFWIATTQQPSHTHATVWHRDLLVHDPDGHAVLGPITHVNFLVVVDPVKTGRGLWRLRGEYS